MAHPVIEIFAYQETLLIMALFGIAILALIWVGFRRWLQYKERVDRLIVKQTVDRGTQENIAQMERVEARLKAIEQIVAEGSGQTAEASSPNALPDPISKPGEI